MLSLLSGGMDGRDFRPSSKKLKKSKGDMAIAPSVTLEGIAFMTAPVSARSLKMHIPI